MDNKLYLEGSDGRRRRKNVSKLIYDPAPHPGERIEIAFTDPASRNRAYLQVFQAADATGRFRDLSEEALERMRRDKRRYDTLKYNVQNHIVEMNPAALSSVLENLRDNWRCLEAYEDYQGMAKLARAGDGLSAYLLLTSDHYAAQLVREAQEGGR